LAGVAGWLGYRAGKQEADQNCQKIAADYRKDIDKLRRKLATLKKRDTRPLPPPPPKRVVKSSASSSRPVSASSSSSAAAPLSEVKDYTEAGGKEAERHPVAKKPVGTKRPELVIIIDDVAYPSQLRAIRALPWRVTPSLFPPDRKHAQTAKMARKSTHCMIHLPLEAIHYTKAEYGTLTVESTEAEVARRIADLRRWFPRCRFVNNHTGSRFTADVRAMTRLMRALKRHGFIFVDSRTTPKTVVAKVCRRFGQPYLARDIFLDNEPNEAYILNQLKKAVRSAKRHGYAIAIGHPHSATLKALAHAGPILQGVEVVYMDELYRNMLGK
jgi:polysaccharide deacetylase 2 family uncharacterized protein YibQ